MVPILMNVFVDENGKYGNPVRVIFDEMNKLDRTVRQRIAKKIGLSETVFVNDSNTGNVNIFNPLEECPFAGHALLGIAWLLNSHNRTPVESLLSAGEKIRTWQKGDFEWIRMRESVLPHWNFKRLENPGAVNRIKLLDTSRINHTVFWSWIDQKQGIIRARTFASDWGIPEDEGNGSGSILLAAQFRRTLEVHHGKGAVLYVKPAGGGFTDVGGRVIEVE